MISLKTHNIMDYVAAAVLVLAPFLFGFSEILEARNVFLFLGFGLAAYSMLTKYYYSALKVIPLGAHMVLDVISGVAVMLAPYVMGYRDLLTNGQFALHAVLGLGVFGLVGLTRTRTESAKTLEERRATTSDHFITPSGTGMAR